MSIVIQCEKCIAKASMILYTSDRRPLFRAPGGWKVDIGGPPDYDSHTYCGLCGVTMEKAFLAKMAELSSNPGRDADEGDC